MTSIASIDIDQNNQKFSISYDEHRKRFHTVTKTTVLKVACCLMLAITFILACTAVHDANANVTEILEMKEVSNDRTKNEGAIRDKLQNIEIEMNRLSLNQHCPNKWVLFNGLCYYFSPKTKTATWE